MGLFTYLIKKQISLLKGSETVIVNKYLILLLYIRFEEFLSGSGCIFRLFLLFYTITMDSSVPVCWFSGIPPVSFIAPSVFSNKNMIIYLNFLRKLI